MGCKWCKTLVEAEISPECRRWKGTKTVTPGLKNAMGQGKAEAGDEGVGVKGARWNRGSLGALRGQN